MTQPPGPPMQPPGPPLQPPGQAPMPPPQAQRANGVAAENEAVRARYMIFLRDPIRDFPDYDALTGLREIASCQDVGSSRRRRPLAIVPPWKRRTSS
jgi:hypothetical protein